MVNDGCPRSDRHPLPRPHDDDDDDNDDEDDDDPPPPTHAVIATPCPVHMVHV